MIILFNVNCSDIFNVYNKLAIKKNNKNIQQDDFTNLILIDYMYRYR
jgi:hypothetical protein